jgi:hypothetical protein
LTRVIYGLRDPVRRLEYEYEYEDAGDHDEKALGDREVAGESAAVVDVRGHENRFNGC